jgi:hypothetical protein
MSSADPKTPADRTVSKKQSTTVMPESHPKKGVFRRLQTEANLLKRNVTQSSSNPTPESRDFFNHTPTHSNASLTALSGNFKRRSDRHSAADESVNAHGTSQPSSPGACASKATGLQLQLKLQRIIDQNRPTVLQLNRIADTFQSLLDDKCKC